MCPRCFGDYDWLDDYCYFYCPYSFDCEEEYYYELLDLLGY